MYQTIGENTMATAKETKETVEKENVENLSYEILVENSKKFQELKRDTKLGVRLSLTGITNLVVNYEDPCLVDMFLKTCFKLSKLYKETYDIDAVELQKGSPGRGLAANYLETLIFGSIEEVDSGHGMDVKVPKTDAQTGKRKRKMDGFINRKEVLTGEFQDKLLVIKNIDYCMDFCQTTPGVVDARNLWIFDNFRNPSIRLGGRLLLITNEPLKLPFKIRTIKLDPVDAFEAQHIIESFLQLYTEGGYTIKCNESQRKQIAAPEWVRPSQITTFLNAPRIDYPDELKTTFQENFDVCGKIAILIGAMTNIVLAQRDATMELINGIVR
jgi:hypothetical protein